MNKIERISAILIQLKSKKNLRAQEIANRFAISLRTVYRDIRSFEETGVPYYW
jgi:predicted DNA-binding transcriptional regulator YafY